MRENELVTLLEEIDGGVEGVVPMGIEVVRRRSQHELHMKVVRVPVRVPVGTELLLDEGVLGRKSP